MIRLLLTGPGMATEEFAFESAAVIGSDESCDVVLRDWSVRREHARVQPGVDGWELVCLGALGAVRINGQRVHGVHGPLQEADTIAVGGYQLTVSLQPAQPHPLLQPVDADGARPAAAGARPDGDGDATRIERRWRAALHARLLEAMNLRNQEFDNLSDHELRERAGARLRDMLEESDGVIPAWLDREALCAAVLAEAVGLGPLEPLLADASISDVMVNAHDEIYVERGGRLEAVDVAFTSDHAVLGVIERIIGPLGRRIDEASPMVDARLSDGSRLNAIIPPLALRGPCLTIRKFPRHNMEVEDLIRLGSLDRAIATFLRACVVSRRNVIVSGGTGSGKTTLLNILSNFIAEGERVVTIEDAAELKLHHSHLVSLEARPSNIEGRGSVTIRDLLKNTLRMRPDRIVVGECRGAEAVDMLQAMNTGHDGSLTTLHANAPRDALARLETLTLMAGLDLPLAAVREQIASAIDIIVQQARFADGRRRIVSVVEVVGLDAGAYVTQELFRFIPGGGASAGRFSGCGATPSFYEALAAAGHLTDASLFAPAAVSG